MPSRLLIEQETFKKRECRLNKKNSRRLGETGLERECHLFFFSSRLQTGGRVGGSDAVMHCHILTMVLPSRIRVQLDLLIQLATGIQSIYNFQLRL